jgi:hypothetical protein
MMEQLEENDRVLHAQMDAQFASIRDGQADIVRLLQQIRVQTKQAVEASAFGASGASTSICALSLVQLPTQLFRAVYMAQE